jgi:hypothetical protein
MGPNEKQKIEIEKLHRDPLPQLNQAVTADYSDFLGTALVVTIESANVRHYFISEKSVGSTLRLLVALWWVTSQNPVWTLNP